MKILFFILLLSFNVLAIGISPVSFDIEASKGEIIEKEFYLYNTDNEDRSFNIAVEGYDWFSFFPSELNLKSNSKEKVKIILEIPDNVSKGIYYGKIYFKEENKRNGVYFSPGVAISYNITIDDGIVHYERVERLKIYHSAAVFEKNVREETRKVRLKPEIVSFGVLSLIVVILLFLLVLRLVKITKHL